MTTKRKEQQKIKETKNKQKRTTEGKAMDGLVEIN